MARESSDRLETGVSNAPRFPADRFSPYTPQGRTEEPVVVDLEPVAEALSPRKGFVVRRRRPVPTGGTRAGFVKCSLQLALVAVFVQHVQFAFARRMKVMAAVGVEVLRVPGGVIESVSRGRIPGRCIQGFAFVITGEDRAVFQ